MAAASSSLLVINAGSSSIKFAVYALDSGLTLSLAGRVERIGRDGTTLWWRARPGDAERRLPMPPDQAAESWLLDWLDTQQPLETVRAAGHRVVHGLARTAPAPITAGVLAELRAATPYAPEHLPREIEMIELLQARQPALTQVACFDTAFHGTMPPAARLLPIPREYYRKGIRRYGFHGLSCEYLIEALARLAGAPAAQGRVILAHLGNGASMTAVHHGTSIDTTMGFTPAAGLVMSTRSGDLDPGVMTFLQRAEGLTAADVDRMINHRSGLLGVAETSGDMRDLLDREAADPRAAEAVAVFCYQAKKWVGALAAALGGLDTLVFSAGIGERSAAIRARICDGLGFLGIELDDNRNAVHASVISAESSRVAVRVVPTDEELIIARSVSRILHHSRDESIGD